MKTTIERFTITGLKIRTTNENGQSATDIPQLWKRFMDEDIAADIPDKQSDDVYVVYTDYELDYTKPYTTVIGYKTSDTADVPEGLSSTIITGGDYEVFTAEGKLSEGIVIREWQRIWASRMSRAYTADFEVYDARVGMDENASVKIFIAV